MYAFAILSIDEIILLSKALVSLINDALFEVFNGLEVEVGVGPDEVRYGAFISEKFILDGVDVLLKASAIFGLLAGAN